VIFEALVTVVALVVVFELFEHVLVPLAAARAGRGGQPLTGAEGMVGKQALVRRWSGRDGKVLVGGELWQATSRDPLEPGDTATVMAVVNLTLELARSGDQEPSAGQPSLPDGPPRRPASPPATRVPSSTQRR
jgi:membrane-bound ClpP family serine protease